MIEKDAHPHTDCAVGHIKGGPVVIADVKIQKIDHLAKPKAINKITHSTTENGSQPVGKERIGLPCLFIKPKQQHRHRRGDKEKKELTNPSGGIGKKAECPPWVQDMGDIEKAGDGDGFVKRQRGENNIFC